MGSEVIGQQSFLEANEHRVMKKNLLGSGFFQDPHLPSHPHAQSYSKGLQCRM